MSHRNARGDRPKALRVLVDLRRMLPGPGHGGVKPALYAYLEHLAAMKVFETPRFELLAVCSPSLAPELPPGTTPATPEADADVVYSPFGYSSLLEGDRPGVALAVDVLHRELAAALPIEEVNYREEQWQKLVRLEHVRLHCTSVYARDQVMQHFGIPARRCFLASHAVHARLTGSGPQPAAGRLSTQMLLYPANFWPHKNHELLLVGYRLYVRSEPQAWPLVLTGHRDARCEQILEMVNGLGLSQWVTYKGYLSDSEFVDLWRRSGALVFPSLHEGFAIPLLEAMTFDVPILASNAAAIPETAGDAALLVDCTRPEALASGLRRITTDAGLRRELAARGRRRLAAFSLERDVETLATVLENCAREAGKVRA